MPGSVLVVADRRRSNNYRYVCGFDGKCLSAPVARLLSLLLIATRRRRRGRRPVSSSQRIIIIITFFIFTVFVHRVQHIIIEMYACLFVF